MVRGVYDIHERTGGRWFREESGMHLAIQTFAKDSSPTLWN